MSLGLLRQKMGMGEHRSEGTRGTLLREVPRCRREACYASRCSFSLTAHASKQAARTDRLEAGQANL